MFTVEVDQDIKLALVQKDFAAHYWRVVSEQQDSLSEWMSWAKHADGEAFFETYVKNSLINYANGKSISCAIIYKGELVGNASLESINHDLKRCDVGYWLSQDKRGNGIVTKSVSYLLSVAFDQLNLDVVHLFAGVENRPSRAVAERLGFQFDGVMANAENINGRIIDHAVYSIRKER